MTDVLITGGYSMLGRSTAKCFREHGLSTKQLSHDECDLCNFDATQFMFTKYDPTYCIHCAGYNGNIQFNAKYPADIFNRTARMALNVLECCHKYNVVKTVSLISSCAYPDTDILREDNFWGGKPNDSVDAHGLSKRIILEYGKQLYKQHGLISVGMICNTVYGPYDSYNIEKTKVAGAVIKKIVDAHKVKAKSVIFWGDGTPRREFIYCDDVARCCYQVLLNYNDTTLPINVGTGTDTSIKELVADVVDIVGYQGDIVWDTSKPNGQMRKQLDVTKMKSLFGVEFTPLQEGLTRTIEWYKNV